MALTSFERRLALTMTLYSLVHGALFGFLQLFYTIVPFWNALFFPVLVFYQIALWICLMSVREHFVLLDGTPMTRVGIPNLLTLFRLSSLPTMTVIFLLARTQRELSLPLVIFVSLAFLTDLLDGFLARTFKMGSRLGQVIDSSSDYIILFTLTVIFGISGVLPLWLLILILVRLAFQMIGQVFLTVRYQKHFLETTFLGKASLFALMVLYAVEILIFLRLPGLAEHWGVLVLEIITGALMVVSLVDKVLFFLKIVRSQRP